MRGERLGAAESGNKSLPDHSHEDAIGAPFRSREKASKFQLRVGPWGRFVLLPAAVNQNVLRLVQVYEMLGAVAGQEVDR
jgi:hypothetical protein